MKPLLWITVVVVMTTSRLHAQTPEITDPVRAFIGGFNPAGEDFFAHDSAVTRLVRMRFDADLDGRTDLAVSETSVFGTGGGPWLLFRKVPSGGYHYLDEFFSEPAGVSVTRDASGRARLTADAAMSASRTHRVRYRVTPRRLIRLGESDTAATVAREQRTPPVEWCALTLYGKDSSCWQPGWPAE